jgi:hypothetical protein
LTYDVSRKQNFLIKAALIWTINDFSTYGMVSSWSMYEKLACLYCMENTKAFTLTNNGKTSFFFNVTGLPIDHKYKKNKKYLFIGRVERDVAPPLLSSKEL